MKHFLFLAVLTFSFVGVSQTQYISNSNFSDSVVSDVKSRYNLELSGDFSQYHILEITMYNISNSDTSEILYTSIDFEDIDPEDIDTWIYENGELNISLGEFLTGTYYLSLALKDDNDIVIEELILD